PDSLDIIVRSLRAGHPVPVAINMVAREMKDPIGSEFGVVVDEITYGADLESALRNLYFRIGQDDLPLFVTAVAIQGSTGGNLGEILENLSGVIRERFKMRRKIRALAAEGRASALILSSLPIAMFLIIQVVAPDFYASVWNEDITKTALAIAGAWMGVGNLIMFKMVNFRDLGDGRPACRGCGRRPAIRVGVVGLSTPRRPALRRHAGGARARRRQAPHRRDRRAVRRGRRSARAARHEPQGGAPPA